MASKWYVSNRNALQKVKRLNKNVVEVTIKNPNGYYCCKVEYSGELKYGRWDVLELAISKLKEKGFEVDFC